MAPHRQRGHAGHAHALVADQDRRVVRRPDDQQRLLEPRVEAGQVGEVGAVLAVRVHEDAIQAGASGALAEPCRAVGVGRRRDLRHAVRHPEVGQDDVGQSRAHGVGTQPRGPSASRSITAKTSASIVCHAPASPSGHVTRTSARSDGPMPT